MRIKPFAWGSLLTANTDLSLLLHPLPVHFYHFPGDAQTLVTVPYSTFKNKNKIKQKNATSVSPFTWD